MKALIIENTRYTHHGQVGVALHEAAARIELIKPWRGEALPASVDADALVVFGGEQSALDDARYPYLAALAELMALYAQEGRAVLGICLGAQVLARAFGARNLLGEAPEHGWCEVAVTPEGVTDPFLAGMPARFPIAQWHSDTFTLPEGATWLATNEAARVQAYRIGRATYGTQFHFEASRAVVADWARCFPDAMERARPGWLAEAAAQVTSHGARADAHGLRLARNWVALI